MVRREVLFLTVVAFAIGAMCGPVDDEQRKPTIISTPQLSVDSENAVELLPDGTGLPTRDQDEELPKDSSSNGDAANESNHVGAGTTEPSASNGPGGTTEIDERYTKEGSTTLKAEESTSTTLEPKVTENSMVGGAGTTKPSANNGPGGTTEIDESYQEDVSTTLKAEESTSTTLKPNAPKNSTETDLNATTTTIIPFDSSTSDGAVTTTIASPPSVTQPAEVTTTHNPEAPVTPTEAGLTTTLNPPVSSTSHAVTTVSVDTTSIEAGTTTATPVTSSSTGIDSETTVTTIKPETTTSGVGLLTSGGVVLLASLVVSWL